MESRPLVVVGAGIAGTAAAIEAAKTGVHVTLIDENPIPTSIVDLNVPQLFGHRYTDDLRDKSAMMANVVAANKLLAEAEQAGVDIQLGTCVWGAFGNSDTSRLLDGPQIGLANYQWSWMIKFDRLIVATGARDLSIGFAGWQLAGAIGANGAHSLMHRYHALSSRRVVILGSGNLGLNTAKMALDNGIEIAAIVETSSSLQGDESLMAELQNQGVELYTSHTVSEASGTDHDIESVVLVEIDDDNNPVASTEKIIPTDTVCLAVGLVPNLELLSLLGCDLTFNPGLGGHLPNHDDWMRTSIDNVFIAGDVAGFHDAMILDPSIARNQGRIAGLSAAESLGAIDNPEAQSRISDIQQGLYESPGFPPLAGEMSEGQRGAKPPTGEMSEEQRGTKPLADAISNRKKWLHSLANSSGQDIFACRCEEVTRAEIVGLQPPRYLEWESAQMNQRSLQTQLEDNPINPNQVKRLTRAGTGICQGRHCREQVALLLAEEANAEVAEIPLMTYRPPVRPLPLNVMWPDDETDQIRNEWPKWFSPTSKVLG